MTGGRRPPHSDHRSLPLRSNHFPPSDVSLRGAQLVTLQLLKADQLSNFTNESRILIFSLYMPMPGIPGFARGPTAPVVHNSTARTGGWHDRPPHSAKDPHLCVDPTYADTVWRSPSP